MRVAMSWLGLVGICWLGACGSADGSCEELAAACAACPDTPAGNQARASCQFAVDSTDELACEDRLDRDIYANAGCTAP